MQGTLKDPGIIPRVAERLIQLIKEKEHSERQEFNGGACSYNSSWTLSASLGGEGRKEKSHSLILLAASYAELYNEKVYDLLNPSDQELPVREDAARNIVIQNIAAVPVNSFQVFQQTYEQGCKNRTTAETKLNASSSRSHAILILKVCWGMRLSEFFFFLTLR